MSNLTLEERIHMVVRESVQMQVWTVTGQPGERAGRIAADAAVRALQGRKRDNPCDGCDVHGCNTCCHAYGDRYWQRGQVRRKARG